MTEREPPSPTPCRDRVETVRVYERPSVKRDQRRTVEVSQYLGLLRQTSVSYRLSKVKPKYWDTFLGRFTEGLS